MANDEPSNHDPSSSTGAAQTNYGATRTSSPSRTNQLQVPVTDKHERPLSTRTARSASPDSEQRPEQDSNSASGRRSQRQRRKRATQKIGLTLANTGSVARDHLASERTYLAYVRTSLGISSMGVAIVQLFRLSSLAGTPGSDPHHRLQHFAQALGATLVLTGLLTLFIGLARFFAVQRALAEGKFPASQAIVVLPAAILAVVICIVFGVLVAFRLQSV